MQMENWFNNLLSKWRSEGVKLNPPASVAEIENAEAVLNFKFPKDFKEFYLRVNGFEDYEWQGHMFSFWSLNRILEEFKVLSDNDFVGFCDYLIFSHCVGFRKSSKGIYKLYPSIDYESVDPIAQTFEEAINLMNTNSGDIY